ncbi:putative reverse transcriptase domain-containing protein [Tanacetum coccineum]
MDPSKIEAVKNWNVPKKPSEIRSFLGLAGYYRCFIANFSKVAKPLASLTQKNQKYEWGKEQEEAFQTLKDDLCNAPILSLPKGSEDFVVYCDASNQGFGCVLMQRGKSSVKDKILVAQSKVSKVENATTEMLRGRDEQMEKKDDGGLYFIDRGWDSIDRHGVSVSIISDHDGRFTSWFWQTLQKALRTRLDMCTAYHPQRMDKVSIPFRFRGYSKSVSLVLWAEVEENRLIRPEMVQETNDKVVLIKERLKAARDRQKSYADNRRKPLEFKVGD